MEESFRGVKRLVLFVLIFLLLFVPGGLLWWPPCAAPDRSSDLGTALIGGGVIAIAILLLERSFAKEAERRDLLLQLGLVSDLRGLDLSERDLSGFHLPGKDLSGADLRRTVLRDANLSGAKLRYADLREADLRGAKLDATELYLSETLVPSEDLVMGPIFPDADLQAVDVKGAAYNSRTRFPQNFGPDVAENAGAECVDRLGKGMKWWYRHRVL